MTRWSNDSDSGHIRRGANSLPFQTGLICDLHTPKIATSGAFTIGVKPVPPMPPRLEMVKHAPCISCGLSLPSRAFLLNSVNSWLISFRPFLSTSLMTGTTRPFGVSAAKPMWKYFFNTRLSPSKDELNSGNCFSALTEALMIKDNGDSFTPSRSHSLFNCLRNSSKSVMSASSFTVTCGIITQLRDRFWPEIFLIRLNSFTSTSPNLAKSTFGHGSKSKPPPKDAPTAAGAPLPAPPCNAALTNALMSSPTMRPFRPVPFTKPKSTPNSRASLRADGPAWALANAASFTGVLPNAATGAAAGAGAETGAAAGAGAAAAFGASATGAGAAAEPAVSTSIIGAPSDTLSPTFTSTAFTTPAAVQGTSIVALSVSSVIRVSSTETVSPTLISTAMMSTFSWPPMSGTATTSTPPAATGAAAGAGAAVAAGASATGAAGASAAAAVSTSRMTPPSDTLSPTLTLTSLTTPAASAGTSMVALSVSSVIRVSSTAMVSPALTSTAMMSTFS